MPIRDRFEELQQKRELLSKGEKKPGKDSNSKKKMDPGKSMPSFLAAASKIEEELAKMKNDVAEIKKLQQDMLSTPFPNKSDVAKYESLGEKVRHDATKIGGSLKELEKKYDTSDLSEDSAFKRMKNQQIGTLSTELNLATNQFFRTQAEYMDKMKGRLRRQLSARGDSGVDESKINEILDKEESFNIFTDNYIGDVQDAEQTLRDLEDRKKDILNLEKSVSDVNKLFKDMNLLVSTQGETLVSIEQSVDHAAIQIEDGNKELGKAKESARKFRRKRCFCIILVLVVLVIVGIILAMSFAA